MPKEGGPIFPEELTYINSLVSFQKQGSSVYYFHGCLPVFTHAEDDLNAFRMFASQMAVNGNCKQVEIAKAVGISTISMKRYVKKYRGGGTAAFYKSRQKHSPRVLTPQVIKQAQELLNEGLSRGQVAQKLDVKPDTLYKAVRSGRLVEGKKKANRRALKVGVA